MLDQKLIRENPDFVEKNLSLRGKIFDINFINKLTLEKKEIDMKISNLQSESKKLSKIIGEEIINNNPDSRELKDLKNKGNNIRIEISELEDKKRALDEQLQNEISSYQFPSKDAPFGENENNNLQIKKWGSLQKNNLKSHWEIGENLNLFETIRSSRISRSRFITLTGNGARLEELLLFYA